MAAVRLRSCLRAVRCMEIELYDRLAWQEDGPACHEAAPLWAQGV